MTGSFQTFAQNPPIKGGFSLQGVPFAGFKFNLGTIPTLEQKHTSKSIISGSDATTLPEPTETKVLYQLDTPPTWFRSADTSSPSSTFTTSRLEGKPPPVFDLPSRQRGSAATENRKDPFDFERTKKQMAEDEEKRLLAAQLTLLSTETKVQNRHEIAGAPIFTSAVLRRFKDQFTQHGFLAGMSDVLDSAQDSTIFSDPRVFFNIAAPSSAFICGSQGSGKSHTLCCLLENCLMKSDVSTLYKPLAGLIFYYDSFTSDVRGTPCEAAYLASNTKIKVRILCSPTNLRTIKRTYEAMDVQVEPLRIDQSDLTTKRMMDLMAVSPDNGPMPLYLHAINRILRELRIEQQESKGSFDYTKFKKQVIASEMTAAQLGPLNQRLDTLESFMPAWQTEVDEIRSKRLRKAAKEIGGNDWSVKPGYLTIVDLSCPCVTAEGACALFNMCLSLFLEQQPTIGRVIALDEAHKYMKDTTEANNLTNTLLSSIRLQRHLGVRVFISTQEPTISPKLLDLCSITIVHRFSSPDWLRCLRLHLAALDHEDEENGQKVNVRTVFNKIVRLRVGEALLFAPSAIIGVVNGKEENGAADVDDQLQVNKLGVGYLKIKIRARVTEDGGKSVLAN